MNSYTPYPSSSITTAAYTPSTSSYAYVPSSSSKPLGNPATTSNYVASSTYTPSNYSYEFKPTTNSPLATLDYNSNSLSKSYTPLSNPAPIIASSYEVNQKPIINIEDLIGKQQFQKFTISDSSSVNVPRSTLPAYNSSSFNKVSPNNEYPFYNT